MIRRTILFVLSLNGNEVDTARQFEADIDRRAGGEKVDLLVQRADERLTIRVIVEEQSAPWDPLADWCPLKTILLPRLGILCIEIDKRVQQLMPDLRKQYGLIVAAKSPDGQAQFIDLEPGDIIHAINNLPVAWLAVFQKTLEEFHRGDAVVLQIERDGRFQFVAFEISEEISSAVSAWAVVSPSTCIPVPGRRRGPGQTLSVSYLVESPPGPRFFRKSLRRQWGRTRSCTGIADPIGPPRLPVPSKT